MVRLIEAEFHSLITKSLMEFLDKNVELHALKILSTKLPLVDQNSRKPTTSYGHSNSHHHSVDLRSKDTLLLKDSVLRVTEKNSLMLS
jgi:hypothetical protein